MNDKKSDQRPSIARISKLQELIVEFSNIQRMLPYANAGRRENDVEHSFGLALTCWFLASKVAPELDIKKILMYALAHDIIEVHSGDTYVFDKAMVATKEAREAAALEQLKNEWPDFSELTQAVEDYQLKANEEAKFVYTVDKILPPLLIKLGDAKTFFAENKITKEMHVAEKQKKMKESEMLSPYLNELTEWMSNPNDFYKL